MISLTAARNREALEWSEEKQKIVGDGGLNQRLEKENKLNSEVFEAKIKKRDQAISALANALDNKAKCNSLLHQCLINELDMLRIDLDSSLSLILEIAAKIEEVMKNINHLKICMECIINCSAGAGALKEINQMLFSDKHLTNLFHQLFQMQWLYEERLIKLTSQLTSNNILSKRLLNKDTELNCEPSSLKQSGDYQLKSELQVAGKSEGGLETALTMARELRSQLYNLPKRSHNAENL
ncbi:unnamed protein product [Dracunculus medinensis]|uniref:Uncharacterized protein n=1 Tax=Dracunculus medinensis TaxID=318479 RepID=A0A0N4UBJ0_DRAME|nr:unnamed protein product [Dracunculus medinensis]